MEAISFSNMFSVFICVIWVSRAIADVHERSPITGRKFKPQLK